MDLGFLYICVIGMSSIKIYIVPLCFPCAQPVYVIPMYWVLWTVLLTPGVLDCWRVVLAVQASPMVLCATMEQHVRYLRHSTYVIMDISQKELMNQGSARLMGFGLGVISLALLKVSLCNFHFLGFDNEELTHSNILAE